MGETLAGKLASANFDPPSYVQDLTLQANGVEDLLAEREKVQKLAEETNGLLKKNVYKNYTQFIETAKEISYLESEMYQLSHMLTEQQAVLNSLLDVSVAGEKVPNMCERETEVKEEDSNKNLSSLLEKVEGCANILEVRGRSLIHSGELTELNISDSKPMQQVYAVLLNDGLMFAVKVDNRRGPVQYRYQTLYELDSLAVVNVKEDPKVKNTFKILMFPDTRFFQCQSSPSKKEWLSVIEQTKKLKLSTFKRELSVSESQTSLFSEEKLPTNPFQEDPVIGVYERESELEMPDWLLELPEDLDVCIAQREFEEAVGLIHKANDHFAAFPKSIAIKEMRSRIENRVKHLVNILMNELKVSPDRSLQGGPRAARRAVSVLIKLGKSSKACDLFLKHRTAILKQSMKQEKMEGATTPYIEKLGSVFFNSMMDTGREYNRAFSNNNSCASAFVVWSKVQLQQFVHTFSRHVFTPQVTSSVAAECIAYVRNHCDQLSEIGLDLTFLLNSLLQGYVERIITESRDKLLEAIKLRANEDKWRPQNHQNSANLKKFLEDMKEIGIASIPTYVYDDCWVSLTLNTTAFSKMYLNFLDDLLKLHTPTVETLINDALVITFQTQLAHVSNSLQNAADKSERSFVSKNATFLLDTLLTLAEHRYVEKLGRSCSQVTDLHNELGKLVPSGITSVTKYSSTTYI